MLFDRQLALCALLSFSAVSNGAALDLTTTPDSASKTEHTSKHDTGSSHHSTSETSSTSPDQASGARLHTYTEPFAVKSTDAQGKVLTVTDLGEVIAHMPTGTKSVEEFVTAYLMNSAHLTVATITTSLEVGPAETGSSAKNNTHSTNTKSNTSHESFKTTDKDSKTSGEFSRTSTSHERSKTSDTSSKSGTSHENSNTSDHSSSTSDKSSRTSDVSAKTSDTSSKASEKITTTMASQAAVSSLNAIPKPTIVTSTETSDGKTVLVPILQGGGVTAPITLAVPTATITSNGPDLTSSVAGVSDKIAALYPALSSWAKNPEPAAASSIINDIGPVIGGVGNLIANLPSGGGGGGGLFGALSGALGSVANGLSEIEGNLAKGSDAVDSVMNALEGLQSDTDDLKRDQDESSSQNHSQTSQKTSDTVSKTSDKTSQTTDKTSKTTDATSETTHKTSETSSPSSSTESSSSSCMKTSTAIDRFVECVITSAPGATATGTPVCKTTTKTVYGCDVTTTDTTSTTVAACALPSSLASAYSSDAAAAGTVVSGKTYPLDLWATSVEVATTLSQWTIPLVSGGTNTTTTSVKPSAAKSSSTATLAVPSTSSVKPKPSSTSSVAPKTSTPVPPTTLKTSTTTVPSPAAPTTTKATSSRQCTLEIAVGGRGIEYDQHCTCNDGSSPPLSTVSDQYTCPDQVRIIGKRTPRTAA